MCLGRGSSLTRGLAPSPTTIFTDGSSPDPRFPHDVDAHVPRIGWVAFLRVPGQRQAVLYGSYTIPDTIIQEWIERRNQVGMVELFGAVAALETLALRIKNTNVLLLVDAEAAQGALVKGYSPLDDHGDLLAVFWEVALEHELSIYVDRVPTDAQT